MDFSHRDSVKFHVPVPRIQNYFPPPMISRFFEDFTISTIVEIISIFSGARFARRVEIIFGRNNIDFFRDAFFALVEIIFGRNNVQEQTKQITPYFNIQIVFLEDLILFGLSKLCFRNIFYYFDFVPTSKLCFGEICYYFNIISISKLCFVKFRYYFNLISTLKLCFIKCRSISTLFQR